MSNANPAGPAMLKSQRDPLLTVTCVFLVVGVLVLVADTVRRIVVANNEAIAMTIAKAEAAAEKKAEKDAEHLRSTPQPGPIEQSASTNVEAAHVTLTNLNDFPVESCFKGIVTPNDNSGLHADSVAVCSGVLKPRSSVALIAPYRVGAVEKLCSSPGAYGISRIDWSKCNFELVSVDGRASPASKPVTTAAK